MDDRSNFEREVRLREQLRKDREEVREEFRVPDDLLAQMETPEGKALAASQWDAHVAFEREAHRRYGHLPVNEEPQEASQGREHVTDGSPCWCEPDTVSFRPATAEYVVEKHGFVEDRHNGHTFYVLPLAGASRYLRFSPAPYGTLIFSKPEGSVLLIGDRHDPTESEIDAFVAAFRLGES